MCVCVYVHVHVYVYICMYIYIYMYICMFIYIYVCMYVCIYIYIYIILYKKKRKILLLYYYYDIVICFTYLPSFPPCSSPPPFLTHTHFISSLLIKLSQLLRRFSAATSLTRLGEGHKRCYFPSPLTITSQRHDTATMTSLFRTNFAIMTSLTSLL